MNYYRDHIKKVKLRNARVIKTSSNILLNEVSFLLASILIMLDKLCNYDADAKLISPTCDINHTVEEKRITFLYNLI